MKKTSLSMTVYNNEGAEVETISLPKECFDVDASDKLLSQYVHVYLANQRQGTRATQTRAEVTGTTKKVYRQKGTGGARHGSRKSPTYVGGGVTFGPQPQDFSLRINKKQKRKALLYSLTLKVRENSIIGMINELSEHIDKTKKATEMLRKLPLVGKKTLVILAEGANQPIRRAFDNVPSVDVIDAKSLNAYTLLSHHTIIMQKDAIDIIKSHYSL